MGPDLNDQELHAFYQMLHPLFVPGIDPDGLQGDGMMGTSIHSDNFQELIEIIENGNFGAGAENIILSILGCTAQVQRVRHEPFGFREAPGRQEPVGFPVEHGRHEPFGFQGAHGFQGPHGRGQFQRRHGQLISRHVNIYLHCNVECRVRR